MKGIVIDKAPSDSTEAEYLLILKDVPMPFPKHGEVLLRIQCSAVNREDLVDSLSLRIKKYDVGTVIGVEVCGTITEFGEGCRRGFRFGEQVIGYIPHGACAEFVAVDERLILPAPFGILSMTTLTAIPLAYMTAYHVAFTVAQVEFGEIVLVHAGGSSVGLALIQMLRKKGIAVVATVRSEAKKLLCESCGANMVINTSETNAKYAKQIIKHFHQGIHVILDPIGSAYLSENILSLEKGGRIVYYGTLSGGQISDTLFLQKLIESEITIRSANLRLQTIPYKAEVLRILSEEWQLLSEIAAGRLKVPIQCTMPLEDFVEAHELLRRNENLGKIVLMVTSSATAVDELQKELEVLQRKEFGNKMRPLSRK